MAFVKLPIELNKEIASYLEKDSDVCTFRLLCQDTCAAVDGDGMSFWRQRFFAHYDGLGRQATNKELKKLYQERRKWLEKRKADFRTGQTRPEMKCLYMLVGLIKEAFNSSPNEVYDINDLRISRNVMAVQHFIKTSNVLDNVLRPIKGSDGPTRFLATVQVCLSKWALDTAFYHETYQFNRSQVAMYASAVDEPMFFGFNKTEVNMTWLLHCMNFFKYHTMREGEQTLFEPYRHLKQDERPDVSRTPINGGPQKLGRYWKGTYSYLERQEVLQLRNGTMKEDYFMDKNIDLADAAIQTMELDFPTDNDIVWPPLFEKHLHSITKEEAPRTRAQHRIAPPNPEPPKSFHFTGEGYDDEDFHACGWLNPLAEQEGIPGWQRMTMMKYFVDEGTGRLDTSALWAYEGVVLPGGQIIMGRWWSPESHTREVDLYSGPFIFWNVDKSMGKKDDGVPLTELEVQ